VSAYGALSTHSGIFPNESIGVPALAIALVLS
jgi:hypothetical protein